MSMIALLASTIDVLPNVLSAGRATG